MRSPVCRAIIVLLTSAISSGAQVTLPTWYARRGDLPALVATPQAIEALITEVTAIAASLEAIDTVERTDNAGVLLLATTATGRSVAATMSLPAALDTLHHYLGTRDRLTRLSLNYNDTRVYRNRGRLLNQSRVGRMAVSFIAAGDHAGASYDVSGHDRERVDKIADRIEAFGRAHRTWRSPKLGEFLKTAALVIALLLLPIALMLRDRRGAVILYPLSAALLATSYLYPFASVFSPVLIVSARQATTKRPSSRGLQGNREAWRLGAAMLSLVGTLALVVAAVGLYSVIAHALSYTHRQKRYPIVTGSIHFGRSRPGVAAW